MGNETKILKKNVRRRKRTKEEISIQVLVKKFGELNDFLPCISDPIDGISMSYLSSVYSETSDLIKDVTMFMVREKYCGVRNTIDNSILKAQDIIGLLREFKDLNTSRKTLGFIDEVSQNKASSLLQLLKVKMNELSQINVMIGESINKSIEKDS